MADLRSLSVLAAVVRHRSFSRAALDLQVAQQAVSRTIATLEAELGVVLVDRQQRPVAPTAAGAALAEDAQRLLVAADAAVERAREIGGAPPANFALGISPGLGDAEVRRVLAALRVAVPGIQLDLVEARPAAVVPLLRDGAVDLVLARYAAGGDGLTVDRVGSTPAGVAVPARHRLARRTTPLALADLAGERVLVWSTRSRARSALEEMLAGVEVEFVVSTVVGRDGLADVARGAAVAIWPAGDEARPGVRLLPLDPAPELPVVAVRREGRPSVTTRRALDAVRSALQARPVGR